MVHYKLTYFHGGTGEIPRQIFALAGQEWEEICVSLEEWPKLKASTPFGQMPVLEEDGKLLSQSNAINRYLARKFGFAGNTPWDEASVDALADQWKDFYNEIGSYVSAVLGFKPGNVEQLKNDVLIPAMTKHFPFFVAALKKNGSGFLVGPSVTYVDLIVAEFVAKLNTTDSKLLGIFPEMKAHQEKVHSIPELKKFHIAGN